METESDERLVGPTVVGWYDEVEVINPELSTGVDGGVGSFLLLEVLLLLTCCWYSFLYVKNNDCKTKIEYRTKVRYRCLKSKCIKT